MPMNEEVRKAVDELSMWVLRSGDQLSECDEWTIIVAELTRLTEIAEGYEGTVCRLHDVTTALESANAKLREIRDSTFRSALVLRSMADRHLSEPRT